ncbi:MAG: prepilin-type cleavage/methylation domain-containing protein [Acidovorax sp.]|nr:prepilin-type cleavage/methylation domain-containing protein [Acidovorax sp.]
MNAGFFYSKGQGHRSARAHQLGLSLLEVAIALVVAGLLSWASFSAYETVTSQQEIERGRAEGQQLQSILRAFALRHGRLPCPDVGVAASGYESLAGLECAAGNQLGWFPYVSLGLQIPQEALRARYAVFRARRDDNRLRDADLAVSLERTGDVESEANYNDVTDLIAGLNNASGLSVATSRPHLTGDAGAAGAINCTTNVVMSVAYWVVVPLKDADNNGNRLDAPHATTSLCAAGPSAPLRFGADDVVVAESPAQLAGWLRQSLP